MPHSIPGLHHVTAISGPPQANVDFYVGLLRQRLVKRTVNFDAPDTYHLYYGDEAGSPGTILTFFPFANAGPGRGGTGMASSVAYGIAKGGLEPWMTRFAERGIDFEGPFERFGETTIALNDPDGLRIELIQQGDADEGGGEAPTDRGFPSVTLLLADPEPTARLLTDLFGYRNSAEASEDTGTRYRFLSPSGARGSAIDLLQTSTPDIARQGTGTVHHIAFRAEDEETQLTWREKAIAWGLDVTPVIDRQYFKSIYFREPGGVLFEIATDPPGFAVDEAPEHLGKALKLPPQHEPRRAEIERTLPEITVPRNIA